FNGGLVATGRFQAGTPNRVIIEGNRAAILSSGIPSFYLDAKALTSSRRDPDQWDPELLSGSDGFQQLARSLGGDLRGDRHAEQPPGSGAHESAGLRHAFLPIRAGIHPVVEWHRVRLQLYEHEQPAAAHRWHPPRARSAGERELSARRLLDVP